MDAKTYQILCRNIEACAESILDSYKALNNPTLDNEYRALISSIFKKTDYCPELSKEGALRILLNGEKLLKQIYQFNIQDIEEEWEPDMDDFGTCDVADTY